MEGKDLLLEVLGDRVYCADGDCPCGEPRRVVLHIDGDGFTAGHLLACANVHVDREARRGR